MASTRTRNVRGTWRTVAFAGLLLAGLAVIAILANRDDGPVPELRLVVLGIDGATWDVIDAHPNELPHLSALRREGTTGTLRAEPPLFSPILWTTLASGQPPDIHGVRGFRVSGGDCRVPRFFDVAAHNGLRVGLYKWLVTSPPRELDGFVVPGWLAETADTWPPELAAAKEVELAWRERKGERPVRGSVAIGLDLVRLGLRANTALHAARAVLASGDRYARLQGVRTEIDRDLFVAAVRRHRPALAALVLYETDAISHRYWGGPEVLEAYRRADAIVGELRRLLPPDGRLVVLSDHGFTAAPEGRRVPRTGALAALLPAGTEVFREGTRLVVVDATGGLDLARVLTEAGVANAFWLEPLAAGVTALSLREEASLPEDWTIRDTAKGTHHADGLFAALGPGVSPGTRATVTPLDVAPTLLAALDLPLGGDLPGRVPHGLWPSVGSVPSWAPLVSPAWPRTDAAWNDARLEALGYVSP